MKIILFILFILFIGDIYNCFNDECNLFTLFSISLSIIVFSVAGWYYSRKNT